MKHVQRHVGCALQLDFEYSVRLPDHRTYRLVNRIGRVLSAADYEFWRALFVRPT